MFVVIIASVFVGGFVLLLLALSAQSEEITERFNKIKSGEIEFITINEYFLIFHHTPLSVDVALNYGKRMTGWVRSGYSDYNIIKQFDYTAQTEVNAYHIDDLEYFFKEVVKI